MIAGPNVPESRGYDGCHKGADGSTNATRNGTNDTDGYESIELLVDGRQSPLLSNQRGAMDIW